MAHVPGQSVPLTLDDVNQLIRQVEEKILSRLDVVLDRFSALEKRLHAVHIEQVRLGNVVEKLKDVIVGQQGQIEKIEAEKCLLNVIVSGIPESNLKVEGEELTSDSEKMAYLCGKIKDSFDA